ncbi:Crp/Fnr family transcriptional regulator [Phaeobacter sp. B1627]|uniref:Crp/Fnr family transcriptional regulator n=1 Tax=Phaeobacter sp. B1627 TaxID=2583809 RepID=UPI00159EBC17|nr:helix-turn-helix domain-containing protein [Phaeobacter sp. B1627]
MYISNASDVETLPAPTTCGALRGQNVNAVQTRALKASQNLFREGDEVRHIYEVTHGVLRLTKVLEDGRRQVIAFGYPGDIVGFPQDGLYHAECDALSTAEVVVHSVTDLVSGDRNPELHRRLVQAALREIGSMQDHFMMLGRKSAREKTASFLSVLMERTGTSLGAYTHFEFPMNRADIADFLGLTVETVSRTMTMLRKSKLITLENSKSVIVLDQKALHDMAA